MTRTLIVFFTIWIGVAAGIATASETQADFPGIKKLMTEQQFRAAGLENLSAKEINALNDWLVHYTAQDAKILSQQSEQVKAASDKVIESRIVGNFKGWTGKTRFVLENGQVWRQRIPGRWKIQLENPEVEIKKNLMGFYKMKVLERGKSIGVKRVK